MADEDYQVGEGVRGTTPFEFANRHPDMVTIKCSVCDFQFKLSLVDYNIQEPRICPVCLEHNLEMTWIIPEDIPARPAQWEGDLNSNLGFEPFETTTKGQPGFYFINDNTQRSVPSKTVNIRYLDRDNIWNISHNLNRLDITVVCVDIDGGIFIPNTTDVIDENTIVLNFGVAKYGHCELYTPDDLAVTKVVWDPRVGWIDDNVILQSMMDSTSIVTANELFSDNRIIIERLPYAWQRAVVNRKIIADFI